MKKRVVAGVSPLDAQHHKQKPPLLGGIQLQASIVINRSPAVCYRYWRDLQNLPRFMSHLEAVSVIDDRRSHWTVAAPADTTMDWDAEIIEDVPNERIAWRSLEGSQIDNAGSVEFVPKNGERQTEVKVALTYNPPLGDVGDVIAGFFQDSPEKHLTADLSRFRDILERRNSL